MRFYNQPHAAYCGVDLHARTMYLHVLDAQGQTRFEKNLPARPDAFLDALAPFRDARGPARPDGAQVAIAQPEKYTHAARRASRPGRSAP